ncbi:glycoside hydrolase superfamily, partial [Suillus spraguei]
MLLAQFVFDAHSHGVQAHVAVGGWLGSVWFSSNIATSEKPDDICQDLHRFFQLSLILNSWEYPGKQGVGCNKISSQPRYPLNPSQTLAENLLLTSPVFAQVFDYITLMNYDVWGPSSTHVGPNAPLNDTCASPENRQGSAVSAIKVWTAAGMPINKIVLECTWNEHANLPGTHMPDVLPVLKNTPDEPGTNTPDLSDSKTPDQPLGDAWDDISSVDVCGILGLMDAGFLNKDGTPADGIDVRYDECSQTPYAYNETSRVMISSDNLRSFAAKGKYIKETGLRGFIMWEVAGDYHDILLDSIREAMGVNTPRMSDITVPAPTPVTSHFIPIPVPGVPNPVPNAPSVPDHTPNIPDLLNLVPSPVLHAPNVPKSVPDVPDVPYYPSPVPNVPDVPDVPDVPNVPYYPSPVPIAPNPVQHPAPYATYGPDDDSDDDSDDNSDDDPFSHD